MVFPAHFFTLYFYTVQFLVRTFLVRKEASSCTNKMKEIDNQVPPVGFEDILGKINQHLDLHVERSNKILKGESPVTYKLTEGFVEQDCYWISDINTSRME